MLHWAFDTMVGICTTLIALGLWLGIGWWRKRDFPQSRWFLRATAVSGLAAVVALECGWIVTEVGRQPWVVYNVMRTTDAVTQASGIWVTFGAVVVALRGAGGRAGHHAAGDGAALARGGRADDDVPYGPGPGVADAVPAEGATVSSADAVAVVLLVGRDDVRRLRRRGLRGRSVEPARRAGRGAAGARVSSSTGRSGPCGRPTTSG